MASFHHEGMELDAPAGTAGRLPRDIQQDESGAPTKLDEWDDKVPTAVRRATRTRCSTRARWSSL